MANGTSGSGSGHRGRLPRLSQEAIVDAARTILEQEGVGHLSMRRLAKDLDSTPMALYHHVRNKDELLLLLLDERARKFTRLALPDDPHDRLLTAAQALHDVLATCPWIVEVLASDDLMAVSAMWIVEDIVDAAINCGMSPEDAMYAYRVIWYYTAGQLLINFTRDRRRAQAGDATYRERTFASLDAEEFPRLVALAERWPELDTRDTHRKGLEDIVTGLIAGNAPAG
ncbi:TetR/AcrR family transcriptional regulator [Actinosynnema sp. NPDC050436]|uniref:TetR/AcrR family transcriptional regulator n=1 Tax=Actinosynnema sp. NPDC050436 TaxID=3155659 RepID=UPI0034096F20